MTFANDIMHQNKAGCISTLANTELQFITIHKVKITRDGTLMLENVLVADWDAHYFLSSDVDPNI